MEPEQKHDADGPDKDVVMIDSADGKRAAGKGSAKVEAENTDGKGNESKESKTDDSATGDKRKGAKNGNVTLKPSEPLFWTNWRSLRTTRSLTRDCGWPRLWVFTTAWSASGQNAKNIYARAGDEKQQNLFNPPRSKPKFPKMEKELMERFLERRRHGRKVSARWLVVTARKIVKRL